MGKVTLVNQRGEHDCAVACVAMLTGLTYEEVEKAYDTPPPYTIEQDAKVLVRLGFWLNTSCNEHIIIEHTYGITVPSLNLPGRNHYIVIDVDKEGRWDVYDPQKGREGKKWYCSANEIFGWSQPCTVVDCRRKE